MPRVRLAGPVTSDNDAKTYRYFGFSVCCPNDVRQAVEDCPDDEELVFELNSCGGSVYAGFEMYNLIRNSSKKTKAEVYSIAGSAAGVIMCACDTVLMSPVSNFMMHRSAACGDYGNAEQHEQTAQMLDSIDKSILNAYVEKADGKTSATEFRRKMENETFMTAQETIACGLADGLIEKPSADTPDPIDTAAHLDMGQSNTMISVITALAKNTLPPVEDLRKRLLNTELRTNKTGEIQKNIGERENEMEINSKEELLAAYPNLVAQIQTDAQTAERERISGIDAVALPGFDEIVSAAKADPSQNAGTVAMAIIEKQKKQGINYVAAANRDANNSGANNVPAAPMEGAKDEGKHTKTDAKNAVKLFEKHGSVV